MTTPDEDQGTIEHINPTTLPMNAAFTQAIAVSGPVKTIYIGGQDAVDVSGNIVGPDDIRAQTAQVMQNIEEALAASGATLEHVIKWTVYVVQGQSAQDAYEVFQRVWGARPNPPTVTLLFVAGLAHPGYLLEIDAIAVVPS